MYKNTLLPPPLVQLTFLFKLNATISMPANDATFFDYD